MTNTTEAALREAIDKALIQISGGLCYTTAEAKHAQLRDAEKTLQDALSQPPASSTAGEKWPAGFKAWHGGTAPDDAGVCCDTIRADGTHDTANKLSIMWGRPKNKGWEGKAEDHWIVAYRPLLSPSSGEPASVAVEAKDRARKLLADLDALLGKPIKTGPVAEAAFQLILSALSKPTPVEAGQ